MYDLKFFDTLYARSWAYILPLPFFVTNFLYDFHIPFCRQKLYYYEYYLKITSAVICQKITSYSYVFKK